MTADTGKPGQPVEGGYRCAECGHGEKLWAWAGCNAYGPLAADGSELAEHEDVWEWGVYGDSIQCRDHPGAILERFVGGQWCRWWSCPKCGGGGIYKYRSQYDREYSSECREETPFPARTIAAKGQGGIHEGWYPAEEFAASPSLLR